MQAAAGVYHPSGADTSPCSCRRLSRGREKVNKANEVERAVGADDVQGAERVSIHPKVNNR